MTQTVDFETMQHDPRDPNPWLALYLDQSTPVDPAVKQAWLEDSSSRCRQFVLPIVRPLARGTIVLFQLVKTVLPNAFTSSPLLHRIRARHADMEELLSSLSPAQMTAPVLDDDWSVKDSLAHLAAWENMMLDWIGSYQRGQLVQRWAPGFEIDGDNGAQQMHRYNAYLFEQHRARELADVLDDFRETFMRVAATMEALSDAEIFDENHFPARSGSPLLDLIIGDTYEHYDEHIGWIRAWLEKTA